MKISRQPDRNDIRDAYEILQWKKSQLTEEQLVRWAQWARLDARLAELLVTALIESFRRIDGLKLFELNYRAQLPQTLAVLIEFARIKAVQCMQKEDRPAFSAWTSCLLEGLPKARPQMYFVPEGRLNPERDLQIARSSLRPYSRWGFFGDENLAVTKSEGPALRTTLTKAQRLQVLERLMRTRQTITVTDYLRGCNWQCHRRAAERDLSSHARLKKKGFTRSTVYVVRQDL